MMLKFIIFLFFFLFPWIQSRRWPVFDSGFALHNSVRCSYKEERFCRLPTSGYTIYPLEVLGNYSKPWIRIDFIDRYFVREVWMLARSVNPYNLSDKYCDYNVYLRNVGFQDDYLCAIGCWPGNSFACNNSRSFRYLQLTSHTKMLEVKAVYVYGKKDRVIKELDEDNRYYKAEAYNWSYEPHPNDDGLGVHDVYPIPGIDETLRNAVRNNLNYSEQQSINSGNKHPESIEDVMWDDDDYDDDDYSFFHDDDDDGEDYGDVGTRRRRNQRMGISLGVKARSSGCGAWVIGITALTYLHLI